MVVRFILFVDIGQIEVSLICNDRVWSLLSVRLRVYHRSEALMGNRPLTIDQSTVTLFCLILFVKRFEEYKKIF